MEAFLLVADDGAAGNDEGVVNMSFGLPAYNDDENYMAGTWCKLLFVHASPAFEGNKQLTLTGKTGELLVKMENDLGIVFVLAGNYDDRDPDAFPDKCMQYLNGGILTGAVDRHGIALELTPGAEDPDVFAPGVDLPSPEGDPIPQTGTSYGECEIVLYHFRGMTLTFVLLI